MDGESRDGVGYLYPRHAQTGKRRASWSRPIKEDLFDFFRKKCSPTRGSCVCLFGEGGRPRKATLKGVSGFGGLCTDCQVSPYSVVVRLLGSIQGSSQDCSNLAATQPGVNEQRVRLSV